MLSLLTIIALAGLAFVACVFMGDADPQGASSDFDAAMSEMDDDPIDPPPEPPKSDTKADPPPAEPPPVDDPQDGDKTAKWSKAMSDLEQFVPEDQKQSFRNRVEQASRWGKGVPDTGPKVKDEYDALVATAKQFTEWFSDGDEQLEKLGPVEFLRHVQSVDPAIFKPKDAAPPKDDPNTPPEVKALKDRLDRLEAEKAQAAQEAQRQAAADKALADFTKAYEPAFKKAIDDIRVRDDDREATSLAFDKLAKGLYVWQANESRGKATPEGCVAAAKEVVDTLLKARLKAGPRPPESKLRITDPDKAPKEDATYDERMEAWDNDLFEDLTKETQ
jgi:hypothetical protein